MNDEFEKRREKFKIHSTHEFKDEFGNVIERRLFNKDLELRSMYKYEYDKRNLLTREIRYNQKKEIRFQIEFKYDDNENLIEYFSYDSEGKPSYKKTYSYKNNLLVVQKGYKLGVEFRYKTLFYYDSDGYRIISHHFNAENKLHVSSIFERNGELYGMISPAGESTIKISHRNENRGKSSPYMKTIEYQTCSGINEK